MYGRSPCEDPSTSLDKQKKSIICKNNIFYVLSGSMRSTPHKLKDLYIKDGYMEIFLNEVFIVSLQEFVEKWCASMKMVG